VAKVLVKAFTDKAGPSIGVSNLTVDGAINTNKTISEDLSIPTGYGSLNHNATINTGITLTIESNADYSVVGSLDIQGTADISGTLTIV
jgi:hypothetical protein